MKPRGPRFGVTEISAPTLASVSGCEKQLTLSADPARRLSELTMWRNASGASPRRVPLAVDEVTLRNSPQRPASSFQPPLRLGRSSRALIRVLLNENPPEIVVVRPMITRPSLSMIAVPETG